MNQDQCCKDKQGSKQRLRRPFKDWKGNGDLWWEEGEKQSAGTEVTSSLLGVLSQL